MSEIQPAAMDALQRKSSSRLPSRMQAANLPPCGRLQRMNPRRMEPNRHNQPRLSALMRATLHQLQANILPCLMPRGRKSTTSHSTSNNDATLLRIRMLHRRHERPIPPTQWRRLPLPWLACRGVGLLWRSLHSGTAALRRLHLAMRPQQMGVRRGHGSACRRRHRARSTCRRRHNPPQLPPPSSHKPPPHAQPLPAAMHPTKALGCPTLGLPIGTHSAAAATSPPTHAPPATSQPPVSTPRGKDAEAHAIAMERNGGVFTNGRMHMHTPAGDPAFTGGTDATAAVTTTERPPGISGGAHGQSIAAGTDQPAPLRPAVFLNTAT